MHLPILDMGGVVESITGFCGEVCSECETLQATRADNNQ